jgi:hypothetical protein
VIRGSWVARTMSGILDGDRRRREPDLRRERTSRRPAYALTHACTGRGGQACLARIARTCQSAVLARSHANDPAGAEVCADLELPAGTDENERSHHGPPAAGSSGAASVDATRDGTRTAAERERRSAAKQQPRVNAAARSERLSAQLISAPAGLPHFREWGTVGYDPSPGSRRRPTRLQKRPPGQG